MTKFTKAQSEAIVDKAVHDAGRLLTAFADLLEGKRVMTVGPYRVSFSEAGTPRATPIDGKPPADQD